MNVDNYNCVLRKPILHLLLEVNELSNWVPLSGIFLRGGCAIITCWSNISIAFRHFLTQEN